MENIVLIGIFIAAVIFLILRSQGLMRIIFLLSLLVMLVGSVISFTLPAVVETGIWVSILGIGAFSIISTWNEVAN